MSANKRQTPKKRRSIATYIKQVLPTLDRTSIQTTKKTSTSEI